MDNVNFIHWVEHITDTSVLPNTPKSSEIVDGCYCLRFISFSRRPKMAKMNIENLKSLVSKVEPHGFMVWAYQIHLIDGNQMNYFFKLIKGSKFIDITINFSQLSSRNEIGISAYTPFFLKIDDSLENAIFECLRFSFEDPFVRLKLLTKELVFKVDTQTSCSLTLNAALERYINEKTNNV